MFVRRKVRCVSSHRMHILVSYFLPLSAIRASSAPEPARLRGGVAAPQCACAASTIDRSATPAPSNNGRFGAGVDARRCWRPPVFYIYTYAYVHIDFRELIAT